MTDTTFSARVTKITAAWAQALNDFLYKGRDATYVTSTGSTNAYKITLPSSLYSAYSEGDEFSFKAHAANTGASTLSINMADAHAKGIHAYGERARAKLTEDQVKAILAMRGTASHREIGAQFNVSGAAVQAIFAGTSWTHIPRPCAACGSF